MPSTGANQISFNGARGFYNMASGLSFGALAQDLIGSGIHRQAAEILLDNARRHHPRKTGGTAGRLNVKTSITERASGAGVRLELFGSRVSMWLVTGTRPHVIEPRSASVLHWVDSDGDHFAASVQHPGTTGHDWRPQVVYSARPQIIALGLQTSRYAIHGLATRMRGAA